MSWQEHMSYEWRECKYLSGWPTWMKMWTKSTILCPLVFDWNVDYILGRLHWQCTWSFHCKRGVRQYIFYVIAGGQTWKPYDCRRVNSQCRLNVGVCITSTGTCDCEAAIPKIEGFEGFDCNLETGKSSDKGDNGSYIKYYINFDNALIFKIFNSILTLINTYRWETNQSLVKNNLVEIFVFMFFFFYFGYSTKKPMIFLLCHSISLFQ